MEKTAIPLCLLTGFLGSGKTTLLNQMLRSPAFSGSALIINEFGDIGVDEYLVRSNGHNLIIASSGCICCEARSGPHASLLEIFARVISGEIETPKRIIVEMTGLADPLPVISELLFLMRKPILAILVIASVCRARVAKRLRITARWIS